MFFCLLGFNELQDGNRTGRLQRLGKGGSVSTSGAPEERQADSEHEKRKKLASGQGAGQRGIRLSEKLADDAHQRIKEEEAARGYTIWFPEPEADQHQKGEEQKALQKSFVELARVPGARIPARISRTCGLCRAAAIISGTLFRVGSILLVC